MNARKLFWQPACLSPSAAVCQPRLCTSRVLGAPKAPHRSCSLCRSKAAQWAGWGRPTKKALWAGYGGPRRHGYPLGRLLQLQRRTAPAVARRPLGLAPARAQPARALRTTHAGDHPQSRCCRRQSRWALASGGLHFGRHPLRLGRHATRRHARVKALQWCRRPANSKASSSFPA